MPIIHRLCVLWIDTPLPHMISHLCVYNQLELQLEYNPTYTPYSSLSLIDARRIDPTSIPYTLPNRGIMDVRGIITLRVAVDEPGYKFHHPSQQ